MNCRRDNKLYIDYTLKKIYKYCYAEILNAFTDGEFDVCSCSRVGGTYSMRVGDIRSCYINAYRYIGKNIKLSHCVYNL